MVSRNRSDGSTKPEAATGGVHDSHDLSGNSGRSAPRASTAKSPAGPTRLRKACDSCSIRKVKCDESGPPCKACFDLNVPCTFQRPTKRRGPPNRHAEALRRNVRPGGVDPTFGKPDPSLLSPCSPEAQPLPNPLTAEAICPFPALKLLLEDFFLYIHPLIPIPHETTFRASLEAREDRTDRRFLALLASMIATLVVSFPRKPKQHLRAEKVDQLFPSSLSLIRRCHQVAVEARGAGYLDRDAHIHDTATSYFLGLTAAYTFDFRRCRLYLSECLAILRIGGIERQNTETSVAHDHQQRHEPSKYEDRKPSPVDYIEQETNRRLFWLMLAASRTLQQLGAPFSDLIIPPASATYHYPPLPAEIDDQYITAKTLGPQPPHQLSKLVGFNINIRIYTSYDSLMAMEMGYGQDRVPNWAHQKKILRECLENVKAIVSKIPPELKLEPNVKGEPSFGSPLGGPNPRTEGSPKPEEMPRDRVPFEIEKANIYGSQLGTRSYIVEKYWLFYASYLSRQNNDQSIHHDPSSIHNPTAYPPEPYPTESSSSDPLDQDKTMLEERQIIIDDLLTVLRSINQVNMEPNSASFINKIRLVASTLVKVSSNGTDPNTNANMASTTSGLSPIAMSPMSIIPDHAAGAGYVSSSSPLPESIPRTIPPITTSIAGTTNPHPSTNSDSTIEAVDVKRQEYLGRFMIALMKLERLRYDDSQDAGEEAELQHWADLRDCQREFIENGGVLSEL